MTLPAQSAHPSVAVVICAYTDQRWKETLEAVASVQSQRPPPAELIVVVDHNPELQARLAAQLPEVRVVANHNERGLSGARNTGVELSAADVIAFLDDDAAARPGWLAALARPYADPDVLGVGGRIEPEWATGRPSWWPPEFDWVVGCSYTGQGSGPVRNLIGANASFRRDLFDDGGFVTGIGRSANVLRPVGGEETEFCIRAAKKRPDGIFLNDDGAAVVHHVPVARQSFFMAETSFFIGQCIHHMEQLFSAKQIQCTHNWLQKSGGAHAVHAYSGDEICFMQLYADLRVPVKLEVYFGLKDTKL